METLRPRSPARGYSDRMPFLSELERATFEREGILFPIAAYDEDRIAPIQARLEVLGRARSGKLPAGLNLKAHLLLPSLWNIVHEPRILDPVESLIGPDLLCLGSSFFDKGPFSREHAPWHQDAKYWGLTRPDVVTAWVAFTSSDVENGCMRVLPGSHRWQLRHEDDSDPDTMLPDREKIALAVDEAAVVDVVLAPGQMSLHHQTLVHGSRPNASGRRRNGFAIRYIPADVARTDGIRGSATLVRGRDYGTFDLETEPEGELHPAALKRHAGILRARTRIVSTGRQRTSMQRDERP